MLATREYPPLLALATCSFFSLARKRGLDRTVVSVILYAVTRMGRPSPTRGPARRGVNAERSVAFRSAKERGFRGRAPCTHGRGDDATIIDSPVPGRKTKTRSLAAVLVGEIAGKAFHPGGSVIDSFGTGGTMQQSWDDLLVAFLHDPPDKALDIRGHVQRACRYASAAVGRDGRCRYAGQAVGPVGIHRGAACRRPRPANTGPVPWNLATAA